MSDTGPESAGELDPQDAKLVTLARSSRARATAAPGTAATSAAVQGAAVRDETGRTYTAATVALPSLSLSALRAAVVLAAASGAGRIEAAAVVGADTTVPPSPEDLAAVRDMGGAGALVAVAGVDGVVASTVRA